MHRSQAWVLVLRCGHPLLLIGRPGGGEAWVKQIRYAVLCFSCLRVGLLSVFIIQFNTIVFETFSCYCNTGSLHMIVADLLTSSIGPLQLT